MRDARGGRCHGQGDLPDVVAVHVLLWPAMDDPASQFPATAASQHHPWGAEEDAEQARRSSRAVGCQHPPGIRCQQGVTPSGLSYLRC